MTNPLTPEEFKALAESQYTPGPWIGRNDPNQRRLEKQNIVSPMTRIVSLMTQPPQISCGWGLNHGLQCHPCHYRQLA